LFYIAFHAAIDTIGNPDGDYIQSTWGEM